MNNFIDANTDQKVSTENFYKFNYNNEFIFKYVYHDAKQIFEEETPNCKDIEDITRGIVKLTDIDSILRDCSRIIADGFFTKKKVDEIKFKKTAFVLSMFSLICSILFVVFLLNSTKYHIHNTLINNSNTNEVSNIKSSSSKSSNQDDFNASKDYSVSCKSYIDELVKNGKIKYEEGFTNTLNNDTNIGDTKNINENLNIINANNQNVDLKNQEDLEEENDEFSIHFLISVCFGIGSFVLMLILAIINFFEKAPKLTSVADLVAFKISKFIHDLNTKYLANGMNFTYADKTKQLTISYYPSNRDGFFKPKID